MDLSDVVGEGSCDSKAELSNEYRQQIQEAFDLFDMDKDRTIDFQEFRTAMRALGFDMKKSEVLKILELHDLNTDCKITFNKFNKAMTDLMLRRDPTEEVIKAFKLFDDDNSGKINIRNLRRVARELGESISDEDLRSMINEFDGDRDGEIDMQEFMAIMMDESN